jgi:lysozyme family protein
VVGLIHLRESSLNFATYLGNGDPLSRPTTHVPKHRGPFPTFLAGSIDALKLDHLTDVHDWRLEKDFYYQELFNGTGYDLHGVPSAYIWGGTNIQRPGKFIRDHVWSSTTWDTQPGIAPVLQQIMKLDPSVQPVRED